MKDWLKLLRPFTLLPPALGMATGALAGLGARGASFETEILLRILRGALMAALLNAASNVLNQIHDLDQDRVNKPARPIPAGRITVAAARRLTGLLYLLAIGLSWTLEAGAGRECFVIVLFTVVVTWAYSAPPLRLRRYGWRANLTVAIPRGLLLKVAGWSTVAPVFHDPEPWYLGSIFFLFLLGATSTKDFADVAGDRMAGVRNLPIRLGTERAIRAISPFFVFPWLLFPLATLGPRPLLSARPWGLDLLGGIGLVYGLYLVRLLRRDPEALVRSGENHPAWGHMYRLMMLAQLGSAAVYLRF